MIDFASCQQLSQNTASLKVVSFDSDAGESMTESLIKVVNFDRVKNEYTKNLDIRLAKGCAPKSCDALYLGKNGEIVFIEFKNGELNKKQRENIRIKILDSLLIFSDLTVKIPNKILTFTRENVHFILVYNEEKNAASSDNESLVQNAEDRTFIASTLAAKSGEIFIQFGFERYKKMYFKEVYTYTKEEFQNLFVAMHPEAPTTEADTN